MKKVTIEQVFNKYLELKTKIKNRKEWDTFTGKSLEYNLSKIEMASRKTLELNTMLSKNEITMLEIMKG